jgi:SAM-dependent methyltransferase
VREREVWGAFWSSTSGGSRFGRMVSFLRPILIGPAVRRYTSRFFSTEGTFLECGCGSGESSSRVSRLSRRLVALDFSMEALLTARAIPIYAAFVQADIRRLPFRDGSISGIWNLGVMEHFEAAEGREILEEFRRVLKPGNAVLLFWPPDFSSTRWILAPIESFLSWRRARAFRVFPDEVNRLRSRRQGLETVAAAGFEPVAADFTWRDWFIHVVLIGRKPLA